MVMLNIGVSGVLLYGCANHTGQTSKNLVFLLFDGSLSVRDKAVRERYYSDFNKVLAGMNPGDRLICDKIGENPLSESEFPINEELPTYNPFSDNPITYKSQLNIQRGRIISKVQEILNDESKKPSKTKILDAIKVAEVVFSNYPEYNHVLVICSDGIEQSDHCNFLRLSLTDNEIVHIIAEERRAGRLSNLKGTTVYFCGAGFGKLKLTTEKLYSVKTFWLRFLKECGAYLPEEHYVSSLVDFKIRGNKDE